MTAFIELGLIILIVLGVSFIMRFLKQPLIIGYLISGILIGPTIFNIIQDNQTVSLFSEFGIAFLSFIIGLHLSPKVIKEVGKISFFTGIGQIIFTIIIGYLIARLLQFSQMTSIYIAIALAFSSTIIMMKLLSDKDALEKLYGKISIGFILVQDLVAVIALVIISSIITSDGTTIGKIFFITILKGTGIILLFGLISQFILPKFEKFLGNSQEFLFLFSIAWGFGISLIFLGIGFSIKVGALIAGILLSFSPYNQEIMSKLKPLKDFFIIFFFITLGSQVIFQNIKEMVLPIIIFSSFVIILNTLITIFIMEKMKYSKKTAFMLGITTAQIGELSLIFIAMGVTANHIPSEIISLITLTALITIFVCTYMIKYSEPIYERISKFLSVFEKKKTIKERSSKKEYDYILFGYNRIGYSIIKSFSKLKKNFLIIDYNPETVENLRRKNFDVLYGDVDDSEFLENVNIYKAKVVVSTIPEKDTNELILDVIKRNKSDTITILTSKQIKDALDLYKQGADYVIMPHFLGGEYVSKLIERSKTDKKEYQKEKEIEMALLKERILDDKEHSKIEKQ